MLAVEPDVETVCDSIHSQKGNWPMLKRLSAVLVLILVYSLHFPCKAETHASERWIGTWACSAMLADGGFRVHAFSGVTLREIAHISIGGKEARIRLTNEFGL